VASTCEPRQQCTIRTTVASVPAVDLANAIPGGTMINAPTKTLSHHRTAFQVHLVVQTVSTFNVWIGRL